MRYALALFLVSLLLAPLSAENVQHGLRVPDGFEVAEFADSKLANDIFSMTLDPRGRVVVSGRGYIRILVDDDHDGKADRAIDFADGPKDGAQGLLWEGTDLYFTGDGGLRRYRAQNGDDRANGPAELICALHTGGEHHAHAIKRGPDGWLYLLCGNTTGIDATYATLLTSPIRQPVAGCVLRFPPDLRHSEIVADGFRNAYDMDFNPDGELFTFDSDNERCVSLPWYEPTRFYHVLPGGHYGWQAPQHAQSWRFPPYFADVVAPLTTLGRGSPTGVACYRHTQFPSHYRGGFFLLDWTFGRVYFVSLKRVGASYQCRQELFLEAVGDNGFAPTAIVVHPVTGDLYLAIGGRGTRGAVYRIRYPQGAGRIEPAAQAGLVVKRRSLSWYTESPRERLQQAAGADDLKRLEALVDLRRHRADFTSAQLEEAILANWDHADRLVRKATADLLATLPARERQELTRRAQRPWQQLTVALALAGAEATEALTLATQLLARRELDPEVQLASVRVIQLALGGLIAAKANGTVWEGYSSRQPSLPPPSVAPATFQKTVTVLRAAFPQGDAVLDREIARTLAMIEDRDPALLDKVVARCSVNSDPVEDVHYLIVLARLQGARSASVTSRTATALLALDEKIRQRHLNRDRHWPLRIAELHVELAHKDPALNAALLAAPEFGRPDHALFARCPGFARRPAAALFLSRAKEAVDYPWTPELVALIADLPAEQCFPVLRRLWDKGGLDEEILKALARRPEPLDRDKFLRGLGSPQLAMIRLCLDALEKLPFAKDGEHLLPLVRCLRCLPEDREGTPLRQRIANDLRRLTGQELPADKHAWSQWFARAYPEQAERLGGADGVDAKRWQQRLAALDWSVGSAERGRAVFTRASCATCHSGAQAIGPDLHGVTGRFSRADLFTAILQPSLDISPRYRTTLVATADDKVYQGIVIYEAVDSLLLQTGPATTIRLAHTQITTRRVTDTSLMPAGLLDKLADRDLADLYAYLRSLGGTGRP